MDDVQPQESHEPLTKKERRELRRQEKVEAAVSVHRRHRARSAAIWLAVLLVVGGSIWALVKFGGKSSGGQTARLIDAVSADDWIQGKADAELALVEYGDYQCPACASYFPIVARLIKEFGDRIAFAYRHFPLRSIHRNADLAAHAAEAAGKQEKFWEMHAKLYETQRNWADAPNAREIFVGYGESIGLNREQFVRDLDSRAVKDRVDQDLASANQAGLNSTPSFFWNGKKIDNPRSYDDFRALVNRDLNP